MKIFDNIELTDLAIYTNRALIVSDFHIGYEEELNKKGILLPRFQFPEIIKRLDSIFSRLKGKKIEKIIINGDLKHGFGAISEQEWRHTLKLLDYFSKRCNEIILIKGNHDTILGPIAKKRDVKVLDCYVIEPIKEKTASISSKIKDFWDTENPKDFLVNKKSNKTDSNKKTIRKKKTLNLKSTNKEITNKTIKKSKILVMHGDKLPKKELLKGISTIIIGHEHPAVSIKEGPRVETFKSFLIGKWKRKNLIVMPSFNLVTEGSDIMKEKVLSPFLRGDLRNFEVVVVGDKLYGFGKLKNLD